VTDSKSNSKRDIEKELMRTIDVFALQYHRTALTPISSFLTNTSPFLTPTTNPPNSNHNNRNQNQNIKKEISNQNEKRSKLSDQSFAQLPKLVEIITQTQHLIDTTLPQLLADIDLYLSHSTPHTHTTLLTTLASGLAQQINRFYSIVETHCPVAEKDASMPPLDAMLGRVMGYFPATVVEVVSNKN
jgi:hypothetical protein